MSNTGSSSRAQLEPVLHTILSSYFPDRLGTDSEELKAASKLLVDFASEKKIIPWEIRSTVKKMAPQLSAEALAEVVKRVIAEISKHKGRITELTMIPSVDHALPMFTHPLFRRHSSSPGPRATHDGLAPKEGPQNPKAQSDPTEVALPELPKHM